MAQPDRSGPKTKTLYEIADERTALLRKGQPFDAKHADGLARDENGNILAAADSDDVIGPLGEAVFLTSSLAMVHFTLDGLVYHQYKQEIEWGPIFRRTGTVFPVLLLLIYLLHTQTAKRLDAVRQVFYFATAVAAGCFMIHVGNQGGYFAVMKQAPPLGTLWIWAVIEMDVWWAVPSMAVNAGFLVSKGYSIF